MSNGILFNIQSSAFMTSWHQDNTILKRLSFKMPMVCKPRKQAGKDSGPLSPRRLPALSQLCSSLSYA